MLYSSFHIKQLLVTVLQTPEFACQFTETCIYGKDKVLTTWQFCLAARGKIRLLTPLI